jgi:hypothetical protein
MAFELADKLACIGIELVDHLIISSGEYDTAIFTEINACEATVLTWEFFDAETRGQVPELSYAVATCRDQEITAELDCVDRTMVSLQAFKQFASVSVPDTNMSIF